MPIKMIRLICFLLMISSLLSCQTFQPDAKEKKSRLAASAIEEAEKQMQRPPISDKEMLESLAPPISLDPVTTNEQRFDVAVKEIDARSFLLGLVDDTPFNMVVSPEVETKITLQLKNVTVSEVLRAVEKVYPLMVEKQGSLFYVSSAETMTAIYPVDYLNLSRKGKSQTHVAGQAVSSGQGQNGGGNQSGGQQSGKSSSSVQQTKSSEIETSSNVDFWKELKGSLELIIRGEESANIVVSPHAGIVVVRALPRTQRLIEDYLGVTQQGLNRQVILEAKIIEVSLNDGFQAGIDWRKINTNSDGDILVFGQQGQVLRTASSDAPLNGIFSALYQGSNFDAAIDLLETQGEVHVLSSPRISTINNQKAVIKVGSDEFFVTDVSTTTVTGNATSTTPNVTLTPFFSGISLDVTPQINQRGEIVLHIHPVVSEISDQQKTLVLGQDEFTLPLALSNVRESDSIVRTTNEQVIVIGGLMQTRIETETNGTPLLSAIPLVGGIFTQQRDVQVKSELVILLKANLVDNQSVRDDLRSARQRINEF